MREYIKPASDACELMPGGGAERGGIPNSGYGSGYKVEAVDDGQLRAALALLHALRSESFLNREKGPCQYGRFRSYSHTMYALFKLRVIERWSVRA